MNNAWLQCHLTHVYIFFRHSTTKHASNPSLTSFIIRSLDVKLSHKAWLPMYAFCAEIHIVCDNIRWRHFYMSHQIGTHYNLKRTLWNLNFLYSNFSLILHKTKWFSKKTALKTQDMISEIGWGKNSLYFFVMMMSPIIDRFKWVLIATSSQPLTLHRCLIAMRERYRNTL